MQAEGLDSFYFFRVDDFWIVDATKVFASLCCCALVPFFVGLLLIVWRAETQSGSLHQPLV